MKKSNKTTYEEGTYSLDREESTRKFKRLYRDMKAADIAGHHFSPSEDFDRVEFYTRRKMSLDHEEIFNEETVYEMLFAEVFRARKTLEDVESSLASVLDMFNEARALGPDESRKDG